MSNADASDSLSPDTTMKGQSRLVVILGDSQTVKESAKKLEAIGDIVRVTRSLFLVNGQVSKNQSILQTLPIISFQKALEIPSVNERGEEVSSKRVYAVVSYRFKNPTALQKKRVERLVRKSISIRVRPGVLLFPVLKAKEKRRLLESDNKNWLMESRRVSEELRNLGAEVSRWSRLRLVDYQIKVDDAVAQTLSQDIASLEMMAKNIRAQIKNPETDLKVLKRRVSLLTRRYRKLKIKWNLARKLWNYDASKLLTRGYNLVISTRRAVESMT